MDGWSRGEVDRWVGLRFVGLDGLDSWMYCI
jgi:hypothetical protein